MFDRFEPYDMSTWQRDGLVYADTHTGLTGRQTKGKRASAWRQVFAAGAIGLSLSLSTASVAMEPSASSLGPRPTNGARVADDAAHFLDRRYEELFASVTKAIPLGRGPELSALCVEVAKGRGREPGDIDAWALGLSGDVIDARD